MRSYDRFLFWPSWILYVHNCTYILQAIAHTLSQCTPRQTTGRPIKLKDQLKNTGISFAWARFTRYTWWWWWWRREHRFYIYTHSPSTFLHFCRKLMFISLFVRVVCSVHFSLLLCILSNWFRLLILIFFFLLSLSFVVVLFVVSVFFSLPRVFFCFLIEYFKRPRTLR